MIYFVLFFIGICNALSLPLTGSVLSIWLTEENFTKEMIGMYALLGLPFSVKIIWSPIIDQFSLPFFRPSALFLHWERENVTLKKYKLS